jgi:hypothetical protein
MHVKGRLPGRDPGRAIENWVKANSSARVFHATEDEIVELLPKRDEMLVGTALNWYSQDYKHWAFTFKKIRFGRLLRRNGVRFISFQGDTFVYLDSLNTNFFNAATNGITVIQQSTHAECKKFGLTNTVAPLMWRVSTQELQEWRGAWNPRSDRVAIIPYRPSDERRRQLAPVLANTLER